MIITKNPVATKTDEIIIIRLTKLAQFITSVRQ